MKRIEINQGQKFGRLTVIKEAEPHINSIGQRIRMMFCQCECGNTTTVSLSHLKSGNTRSCGCLKKECGKQIVRNEDAESQRLRIKMIWRCMKNRCNAKNGKTFRNYGSKGITVCDEWHDFEKFYKWALNNGYHSTLSIDRVDGTKGYSPDNCRWATAKQQANNIRTNISLTLNGLSHTVHEWGDLLNIKPSILYERKYKGWNDEKTLTTPVKKRKRLI